MSINFPEGMVVDRKDGLKSFNVRADCIDERFFSQWGKFDISISLKTS